MRRQGRWAPPWRRRRQRPEAVDEGDHEPVAGGRRLGLAPPLAVQPDPRAPAPGVDAAGERAWDDEDTPHVRVLGDAGGPLVGRRPAERHGVVDAPPVGADPSPAERLRSPRQSHAPEHTYVTPGVPVVHLYQPGTGGTTACCGARLTTLPASDRVVTGAVSRPTCTGPA